ncbi:MAG: hypothetical protein NT069_07325 [Planctomycetota bacterium]|nr:hypothetical protein [Planctomycetota bacterium]
MPHTLRSTVTHFLNRTLDATPIRELAILSDMTGTLLDQTDDGSGFAPSLRAAVANFVEAGGVFVLISGDSEAIVEDQFLRRLPPGIGPVFFAPASGSKIGCWRSDSAGTSPEILFELPPAPPSTLRALTQRVEQILAERVPGFRFTPEQREVFLSPAGGRPDVSGQLGLGEIAWVECRPDKGFAIFFPGSRRAAGLACQLIDDVAYDSEIRTIAEDSQLRIIRGANFCDVILSDKGAAVNRIRQLPALAPLLDRRTLIVLGDGRNDLEMYAAAADGVHVFVGAEEDFTTVTGGGDRAIHIPGFTRGTEVFLDALASSRTSPVARSDESGR